MQQASCRLIALCVGAVSLVSWSGLVFAAPEPSPVDARLEINTRGAGAGADVLRRRIEERANIVLRRAKIVTGGADDVALRVLVVELEGDEPGYLVTFEIRAANGSMPNAPSEFECPLCTETELVARVEAELEPIVPMLRELATAPDEPTQAEGPIAAPEPEPEPEGPTARPKSDTGMLAGGVTLMGLGAVSLGAAIGLVAPKPKIDQDNPLDLITTRPVGYPLLAVGATFVVVGAILTAVVVSKRQKSKLSVAPYGGRGLAGLALGWRFQ